MSDKMKKECSIIVSNKNRIELLKQCLKSIEENTKDVNYNLHVIDVGSTDGSREYLQELYDSKKIYRLILEDTPSTYAESNNREMRKCKTPYIYLLNNDCLVLSGWLRNAIDFAKSDKKIGHVASLVLWNENKVQSHGANILKNGNTHCCYQGLNKDDARLKEIKNYSYAGLGLYRNDLLKKVDYMPEYPSKIYWSDTGYAMRVWEAGYDVRYCPDSHVIHTLHPSERTCHSADVNQGRIAFMEDWGKFLEENNGFTPDYPFTGKRPYRNRSK
ncbi:MAG TPA: glycosyltransferase [Atribacterota bacterium]|jgi:hypothetical protein|nr:glycosyltransferase [Atribacterota bacterium]